jgi:hypothetical protein
MFILHLWFFLQLSIIAVHILLKYHIFTILLPFIVNLISSPCILRKVALKMHYRNSAHLSKCLGTILIFPTTLLSVTTDWRNMLLHWNIFVSFIVRHHTYDFLILYNNCYLNHWCLNLFWIILHEFCYLFLRTDLVQRMRWVGYEECLGAVMNANRILVIKPEWKRQFGRPKRIWEGNIKIDS